MVRRIVLLLLLAVSADVLGDARTGDFMGYQLGARYQAGPDTKQRVTTTGNLIIVAERPVKPADLAEVSLATTPATLTIGHITASQWFGTEEEARDFARRYFGLLRAKYPAWQVGGEVMDGRMNIVEVRFDASPYSLQLRLTPEQHEGRPMWRYAMTLTWLPESSPARAWRDLAAAEQLAVKSAADRDLLERADLRGL